MTFSTLVKRMYAEGGELHPDDSRLTFILEPKLRTGRTCRRFAEVRVLVGDAQGWYFLTAPGDPS